MNHHLNTVKSREARKREGYHHGDLKNALILASEEILRERGATGFSLREAARRAGVSPGAPAHHFGDARGLLTAVAARGFDRLTEGLLRASENAAPADRVKLIGAAYLNFALENGALFGIMWLRDLLDQTDTEYLRAGRAAFNVFEQAALEQNVPVATAPHVPDAPVIAAWAMVHGLARLTLDGALDAVPQDTQGRVLDLMAAVGEGGKPRGDSVGLCQP
jgi:AcrR family transcriptional regulator